MVDEKEKKEDNAGAHPGPPAVRFAFQALGIPHSSLLRSLLALHHTHTFNKHKALLLHLNICLYVGVFMVNTPSQYTAQPKKKFSIPSMDFSSWMARPYWDSLGSNCKRVVQGA